MIKKICKSVCIVMTLCMLGSNLVFAAPVPDKGKEENEVERMDVTQGELENLALSAAANSTGADPQYPASLLNDGSYGQFNGMVSKENVELPTYETYIWEQPQTFNTVNMVTWYSLSQAPSNWDIEVSENGVDDWKQVASSGDVVWEKSDKTIEQKAITFPTVENVKGMRVKTNKANMAAGWGNKYAILEIEVFNDTQETGEKIPQSLEIVKKPAKTLYTKGEELNLAGMEVKVKYSNGITEPVTDYQVSGYDKDIVGKQTVEVSYTKDSVTVRTTFYVTVGSDADSTKQPVLNDLDPAQWVYQFGDDFDEPELSDMWEPSYFSYWAHSSVTPQSIYDIKDGVLSQIVKADSPYYDATTDYGFRNPGMSLGVRDYVHMYRDNLIQYRHMPTDDKYITKYGYYELRAKLNPVNGSCAAWWMTGFQDKETDTAEIDIIEYAGNKVNGKNKIGGWMYNWDDPKLTSATDSPVLVDFPPSEDYHVYGMEWQPGYLKFYVDGELKSTINQSPDYRMQTWISYNHHDSNTAGSTFPKEWGIDYFRVWQDKDLLETEVKEEAAPGENLAADAYASTVGISASHYKKNPPLRLNDGSETTLYKTPDSKSYPYYLYLDWTEPQTVNTLTMKCQNSQNQAPTDYDIEYSEDGKHGWKPVVQNVKPEWTKGDETVESSTTCFETLQDVKYLRVRVNKANTVPGYFAVNELEVSYQPDASPSASPESFVENYAPYAVVTSSGQNVNYPAGDVADEVYLNEYRSESNPQFPYYITFNWEEGKSFSELAMTANNCLSGAPYDFEVQVSSDGTSGWTTVAEVKEVDWYTDGMYETQYIDFAKVENQKGCRIKINQANTKNGYFKLSEVEVNSIPAPEDRRRKLSENDNLGIFAVANSTSASAQYPANLLNDGTYENGMVTIKGVKFPTYETFIWNKPQTFNKVNMVTWWSKSQAPTNWDIEVSEDGINNWTKIASSGDVEWEESSKKIEQKAVTFPTVENVKGMRVKVNNANLEWENKFAILEIEVFNEAQEPEDKPVSKKTLEYFLNAAKEHVANGDVEDCVESVKKLFNEAIAEGEAVMLDENASETTVTTAAAKLMKAIQALELKAADKADLEMALALADIVDLTKYIEAGQTEFTAALENARTVRDNGDAMQAETDEAWNALVDALANLRLKADKDALRDLLDSVKDLDLNKYTEESAEKFKIALVNAQAVLEDETLSVDDQKTVNDAVLKLASAKEELKLKDGSGDDNNNGNGSNNGNNGNGSNNGNNANTGKNTVSQPKTGDNAPMTALIIFLALSAGAAAYIIGAKRKVR